MYHGKEREVMHKFIHYLIPASGTVSILLFCVSATASFADARTLVGDSFSEPFNMLLIGFGLIGAARFLKRKQYKRPQVAEHLVLSELTHTNPIVLSGRAKISLS